MAIIGVKPLNLLTTFTIGGMGLIDKYKNLRKQKYLGQGQTYKQQYAFVGVGNHSISNLYPVISFMDLPLRKICTRTLENARSMASKFKNCTGVNKLEDLISDPEIKGIFVCSSPSAHYGMVKQLLEGGKHVFVEKPPCENLAELEQLISAGSGKIVVTGLQRRFNEVNKILKKDLKGVISYNGRFLTGGYPEGDAVMDMYIHPVDNCLFLFGAVEKVVVHKAGGGETLMVQLIHQSGVVGNLELSTAYSWSSAVDVLHINTDSASYEVEYPNKLVQHSKSKRIMGIPLEKVMKHAPESRILYHNSGFIPTRDYNSLQTQGYAGEIQCFVDLVEGRGNRNPASLEDVLGTYKVLEKLKTAK